jgi:glucokinase
MRVLVGDIGGTKTVLALAETDGDSVHLAAARRYPSRKLGSLDAAVRRFLDEIGESCEQAAFAVAGPVKQDRSRVTNLPWELDARLLERSLNLRLARLLNDLEAVAWGIPALDPRDLETLHPGEDGAQGNACVVAAGTGLGEAGLYWDGKRHHPFATEGGHTDFAPTDELELALLRRLKARYGRVSWERVVSGMGIANLYEFLSSREGVSTSEPLRAAIERGDAAAAIAEAAANGSCSVCAETMNLFVTLYAREAGNMALKQMALGGVYLGGGIVPKNLSLMRGPAFLRAFFDKGRMEPLMRRMPIKLILNDGVPLLGAARFLSGV